jgi:hypothetical protein
MLAVAGWRVRWDFFDLEILGLLSNFSEYSQRFGCSIREWFGVIRGHGLTQRGFCDLAS